jgi:hypothetical protein
MIGDFVLMEYEFCLLKGTCHQTRCFYLKPFEIIILELFLLLALRAVTSKDRFLEHTQTPYRSSCVEFLSGEMISPAHFVATHHS